ncbi:MAG: hypothetical protein ABI400_08655 [Lacisediminihabitans sp.]
MTSQANTFSKELSKPAAGGLFLLLWAVAIVAWSLSHLATNPAVGAFIVDVGIVAASVGFAALFLGTVSALRSAVVLAVIAIVIFLVADLLHITGIVYLLRILGPFLALLTPIFKVGDSIRIFN